MAISLKEQFKQARQLKEVSYHVPKFDTKYYKKNYNNHGIGRETGKKLFYDFYAMEFLWSFLGSGQIPKSERAKTRDLDPEHPSANIVQNKSHRFLPDASVRVIDDVYQQVTEATASRLIGYIRAAVHQEFRYLIDQSSFQGFRHELVTKYNAKKTLTKEDFDRAIEMNIPDMEQYPDTIHKLLKFVKIYKKLTGNSFGQDPYDMANPAKPNEPDFVEPDEPVSALEPDESDDDEEIPGPEFGKYGGAGQPEYPDAQNWSGLSAFKDAGPLPKIPADDDEDDGKPISEGSINIGVLKPAYKAALLAGMTLQDLYRGYTFVPWNSSFGGERWGAAVEALIKLIDARNKHDFDAMNAIIDHIYDLQHNTASLLNKGPMFISDEDLNRRYKITDITRFIPFVSGTVKTLIQRYHPYLRPTKEQADTESNMEDLLKSPTELFIPDEAAELTKLGMQPDISKYKINIKFLNKKKQEVGGSHYTLTKHKVGSFSNNGQFQEAEGKPIKYVVADNYKADVKAFDKFDDAVKYIERFRRDFQYTPAPSVFTSHPVAQSEKEKYIKSHSKIRLPIDKEEQLLTIQMAWVHGSKYYMAYLPPDKQFMLYAFSDGTYLTSYRYQDGHQVYSNWNTAFETTKAQLAANGVLDHPNKEIAQAEIDAIKSGKYDANVAANAPTFVKQFELEPAAVDQLIDLVKVKLPQTPQQSFEVQSDSDGTYKIVKKNYHLAHSMLKVGRILDSSHGKRFVVTTGKIKQMFNSWEETYDYISKNLFSLMGIKQPASVTPMAYADTGNLPAHSASTTAYSFHSGLSKAPTGTLRLTEEDEQKLVDAGFKPQMINGNVCYIHVNTGDMAKFFPNNSAKMVFANMPSAGMTETIDKMIAWILNKYNTSITKSPLKTGASISSTSPAIGTSSKGVTAGIMFDGHIKNAGFTWDSEKGQYVDGNTTLKIAPNRTSLLTFGNKSYNPLAFKDLTGLMSYLSKHYPTIKNAASTPTPSVLPQITTYPQGMPEKVLELLHKGKFKYTGTVYGQTSIGYSYENDSKDEVVVYPGGVSTAKDSLNPSKIEPYNNYDELLGFLQEKYGSLPMPLLLNPKPST